jgi:hypothetical protein
MRAWDAEVTEIAAVCCLRSIDDLRLLVDMPGDDSSIFAMYG